MSLKKKEYPRKSEGRNLNINEIGLIIIITSVFSRISEAIVLGLQHSAKNEAYYHRQLCRNWQFFLVCSDIDMLLL